jgi:hypothetical protein
MVENYPNFIFLRPYLLTTSTTNEHRIGFKRANAIDSNDQNTINDALVQAEQNKKPKCIDNLIIHYTHEARLESYNS